MGQAFFYKAYGGLGEAAGIHAAAHLFEVLVQLFQKPVGFGVKPQACFNRSKAQEGGKTVPRTVLAWGTFAGDSPCAAMGGIRVLGEVVLADAGCVRRNAEGLFAPQAPLFLPPEKAAGKRPLKGGNLSTFPPLRNPSFHRLKRGRSPPLSLETPFGLERQSLCCCGMGLGLANAPT